MTGIKQLAELPEYSLLNERQQRFLAEYLANGYDARAAVKASYPNVRTRESARVMAIRILQSPAMVMLLSLHYGDSPQEAFCRMLGRMVARGKISREQLEAIKLLAEIRGFRKLHRATPENQPAHAAEGGHAPGPSLLPDFENL